MLPNGRRTTRPDLKGCIVTIDARGCQTEIAQSIVDRGGDYLLAVKDNQPKLADALREFFAEKAARGVGTLPFSQFSTLGKDHGRIETRHATWVNDLSWRDKPIQRHWPKLAGVGMIERRRESHDTRSIEHAFYIGTPGIADAQTFAVAARSHGGIENSLHWVLDVTFREDDCRVRKGHTSRHCANSLWPFCAPIKPSPNAVCVPDEKPPTASRTIAPPCSAYYLWGKCDCPAWKQSRGRFVALVC